MATTGIEGSGIPPKERNHAHLDPNAGSAVASPEYDPFKPRSDGPPPVSAADDEPQSYHEVDESGHPTSQHAWPQSLQNVGMHSATPLNDFAAKMGSESFMPVSMDKESEKAARILRSFCKDGIYHDPQHAPSSAPAQPREPSSNSTSPNSKHHNLLTIPSKVISGAVGLAIFTTARAGFHISGAAGSGVLIARLPDGSWSPPSGIQVHALGAGFLIGADIYDCVCVINTHEALETFMKTRLSLGPELSVTAGPFGVGGRMDFTAPTKQHEAVVPEKHRKHFQDAKPKKVPIDNADTLAAADDIPVGGSDLNSGKFHESKLSPLRDALKKPVYSYVNSRGFYAGIQVDGTVITERKDANAAFYGEKIPVEKILRGEVPAQGPPGMWPVGARILLEVLKGAVAWRGSHEADEDPGVQQMNIQDRNNDPLPAAVAHRE